MSELLLWGGGGGGGRRRRRGGQGQGQGQDRAALHLCPVSRFCWVHLRVSCCCANKQAFHTNANMNKRHKIQKNLFKQSGKLQWTAFYCSWNNVGGKEQAMSSAFSLSCAIVILHIAQIFLFSSDFTAYCVSSLPPEYNWESKLNCPLNNISTFYSYWYLPVKGWFWCVFAERLIFPTRSAEISFCKSPRSHFIGEKSRPKNIIFFGKQCVYSQFHRRKQQDNKIIFGEWYVYKFNLFDPLAGT